MAFIVIERGGEMRKINFVNFLFFFLLVFSGFLSAAPPAQIIKEPMRFVHERGTLEPYDVYSYDEVCGLYFQRNPPKDFDSFLIRNGQLVVNDDGTVVKELFTWGAESNEIQPQMRRVLCKGVFSGNYGTKKPTVDVLVFDSCVNIWVANLTSDGLACVKLLYNEANAQGESSDAACRMVGNPIDVSTGNKFQEETDLGIIGLARYYNSISGVWVNSYDYRLVIAGQHQAVYFPDGRYFPFGTALKNADSSSDGSSGKYSSSFLHADSLVMKDGVIIYKNAEGLELKFQKDGRVSSVRRAVGPAISTYTISYSGNDTFISDAHGKFLKIENDEGGNIRKAEYQGVVVEYKYDSKARLVNVSKHYLDGSEDGRTYHYESPQGDKLLTGITDERGVRFATWVYDENKKAILSEHALGAGRTEVKYESYEPGGNRNVYVTNALGAAYKYVITSNSQPFKVIRLGTSNYPFNRVMLGNTNDGGYLESSGESYVGDNEGSNAEYGGEPEGEVRIQRNDLGLEKSRSIRGWASGSSSSLDKTTTKEWDSDRLVLTRQTENGRVIEYSYDEKGRLISVSESSDSAN